MDSPICSSAAKRSHRSAVLNSMRALLHQAVRLVQKYPCNLEGALLRELAEHARQQRIALRQLADAAFRQLDFARLFEQLLREALLLDRRKRLVLAGVAGLARLDACPFGARPGRFRGAPPRLESAGRARLERAGVERLERAS